MKRFLVILLALSLLSGFSAFAQSDKKEEKKYDGKTAEEWVKQLEGDGIFKRGRAAHALGILKDPATIPALIKALHDKNMTVRNFVVRALAAIGEPAIPDLIQALKDQDQDVVGRVAQLLKIITKQDFGKDVGKWEDWFKKRK